MEAVYLAQTAKDQAALSFTFVAESQLWAIFCVMEFEPLANDQILDMTKLKAFADNKLNFDKMTIFLSDKVENTEGKGENAGYQHFLLFPQCFFKGFLSTVVKSRDCVVKIYYNMQTTSTQVGLHSLRKF